MPGGGGGGNLPLMLSEGSYININNNNHYYDVYVCVYVSLQSHFVTTTASGLHAFFSFLQDGNDSVL